MTENELSRTAGLCSQEVWQQPHISQLGAQNFHQGILQDIFFWFLNPLIIKFVNTVFLFYIFLSKANLKHVPLESQHSYKDIVQSPGNFWFIIKVSEKIIQSSEKSNQWTFFQLKECCSLFLLSPSRHLNCLDGTLEHWPQSQEPWEAPACRVETGMTLKRTKVDLLLYIPGQGGIASYMFPVAVGLTGCARDKTWET